MKKVGILLLQERCSVQLLEKPKETAENSADVPETSDESDGKSLF